MSPSSESSKTTTAASTTVVALAIISVALRFYARIKIKAGVASDDWWILVGLVLTCITGGLLLYGTKSEPDGGELIDRDSPTFDYKPHVTYLQMSFVTATLYFSVVTAIKISILLFYRRIFSTANFRLRLLVVGIAVLSWWFAGTISTIISCIPVHRLWVGPSAGGYCFNFNIFWMVMGAVELVIDTAILVLPVGMVLGLQLSRRQKILLGGIFLLGGFVIITGLLRVIYGYKPGSQNVAFSKAELWSGVHVGTAIVCACLPTLRPLFVRTTASASSLWHRTHSTTRNSSSARDLKNESVSSTALSTLASRNFTEETHDIYSDSAKLTRV